MSKVLINDSHLHAIADAIREKNGKTDTYKPREIATAIRTIPTGGGGVLVSLTATENGIYTPSQGADGFSTVLVNVENQGFAFVTVDNYTGKVVTATDGTTTLTGDDSAKCVFLLPNGGTWTFAAGEETCVAVVSKKGSATSIAIGVPPIVPWATGTDEQIAAMVLAMDSGMITAADTGWQIGDERAVELSAMEAKVG